MSFNPRAPEGARRNCNCVENESFGVSIRAPPKGRDDPAALDDLAAMLFQSARPRRGATR